MANKDFKVKNGLSFFDGSTRVDGNNINSGIITATEFKGPLSGNASTATNATTASEAVKLQTTRTISLGSDLSGSASFDGSQNITINATIQENSVALGTDTVGNYVASVANGNYLTGGAAGSEGATLTLGVDATTTNTASKVVARDASGNFATNTITLDGELRGPSSFVIDPAVVGDDTGTVVIKGNLQVDGTTTTVNSTTVTIDDKNIVLAADAADASAANGGGITINGAAATLTYSSTGDKWVFNKSVESSSFLGNSSTATKLATPRSIAFSGDLGGSASFDGSQNITINATIQENSVALGTDTVGNYVADVIAGAGLVKTSSASEGQSVDLAIGAGTGIAVNADSIALNFNGLTTTDLADDDQFAFYDTSGTTYGKISSDGLRDYVLGGVSGDILINSSGVATIQANSVALGTDTVGNYVASVANGNYLTGGAAGSEGAVLTLGVDATSNNTGSKVVARDSNGGFLAGIVTATEFKGSLTGSLTGNASTATKLETSRTIQVSGDVSGSASFDGSADANINVTIANNSVELGADTFGNYVASVANGNYLTGGGAGSEGATLTLGVDATVGQLNGFGIIDVSSIASKVVARNSNGGFLAGIVTASSFDGPIEISSLSYPDPGTTRYVNFTSGNSGYQSVYGSGNLTYVESTGTLSATRFTSTVATGTAPLTVTSTTQVNNLNSQYLNGLSASTSGTSNVVSRDASGNFSAGTITATLVGTATSATILQTARTINGVSFNGSSNITITSNTTNSLTNGSYLTGSAFNGSAAVTFAVDATSANTGSKVVARDSDGGFLAGIITATEFKGPFNASGISTISVNSSSTALRITQTGTGAALRVEDSTNPDTSPFIVTATGAVGIGIESPTVKLYVSGDAQVTGFLEANNGIVNNLNGILGTSYTEYEIPSGANNNNLTLKIHSRINNNPSQYIGSCYEETFYVHWMNTDSQYIYLYPVGLGATSSYSSLYVRTSIAAVGYTDSSTSGGTVAARFGGEVANGFTKTGTAWAAGTASNLGHANSSFAAVPALVVSPSGIPSIRLSRSNTTASHYSQYVVKTFVIAN